MTLDPYVHERQLAKLLRDLLRENEFETLADVQEALKSRAAQLKIYYGGEAIDRAIAMVNSNTPIVVRRREQPRKQLQSEGPVFNRIEARRIYDELFERFNREHSDDDSSRETNGRGRCD
jgi:hypothetical protein